MKNTFKTIFLTCALLWASLAYADNSIQPVEKEFKSDLKQFLASPEVQKEDKTDKYQEKDKNTEQKNESWTWKKDDNIDSKKDDAGEEIDTKEKKIEKEKLVKNINKLIIESFKAKFAKILDNLSYNIKWKTKEEKLKILSSVLVSTNSKITLVESWKMKMTSNKKQVLLGILYYIKDEVEDDVKAIAKEK